MSAKAMLIIMGAAALCLPAYTLVRLHRGQRNGWRRFSFISILLDYNCAMMQVETKFRLISISASPATMDSTMSASCSGSESCG